MSSLSRTPEENNFLAIAGFTIIIVVVLHLNYVYSKIFTGEITYFRYILQAIVEGGIGCGLGVWLYLKSGKI